MTAVVRRTQEERSAATRELLLDATLDAIVDLGYRATSTTEICRRAGVSRGAQVHHFPSKASLVGAAMERLFDERRADFDRRFDALPEERRTLASATEVLWSMYDGRTFPAWLELTVAARTDAELRARLVDVERHFESGVQDTFRRLFPQTASSPLAATIVRLAVATLDGLALNAVVHDDGHEIEAVVVSLQQLSTVIGPLIGGGTR